MTTASEGAELTRIGPGTVMGELMRQYWIPALKSAELERDGAPVRLMLLGEKLIAFRDSDGRVGVMDHRCPHRCASLFLGRNEEGGMRCIYHGWKFDVDGNCVDMPNVPPQQDFKDKVKAKAYKAVERDGLLWVYMGARAEAPPLPAARCSTLPDGEVNIGSCQRDCNWLQALEGDIDTSHFGFLHAGHVDPARLDRERAALPHGDQPRARVPRHRHAVGHAVRRLPAGRRRTAPTGASPTSCSRSGRRRRKASSDSHVHGRAWVPMDDDHTMFVFIWWKRARAGEQPAAPASRTARRSAAPAAATTAAQHHRLARPLAPGRQRGQRLGDRPRGAAHQPHLHRHRRHPPAGPGGHREHGADHRPRVRAPRPERPDDRPHAPAAAAWRRARCATRAPLPPGVEDGERLSRRRAAAISSATTSAPGATSTTRDSPRRCTPGPAPARAAE